MVDMTSLIQELNVLEVIANLAWQEKLSHNYRYRWSFASLYP